MQAITLWILLALSIPALARTDCELELSGRRLETQQKFNTVVNSLRAMGLQNLTRPLDLGNVKIIFPHPLLDWRSLLRMQGVVGKKNLQGKNKLIISHLDLSNEKQRQLALWQVALALYQMQIDKHLLILRSMVPRQNLPREFDLSGKGNEDIMDYFLHELPIQWSDERLRDIAALEDDLYRLRSQMTEWSDSELLAPKDIGPLSWVATLTLSIDATQWIRPNQQDYNKWKRDAGVSLADTLNSRHRHLVLFNYYFDYIKRGILAAFVLGLIAHAPQLPAVPSQVSHDYKTYQSMQEQPPSAEQLHQKYIRHLSDEN